MSRGALIFAVVVALALDVSASRAQSVDPHLDPVTVPGSCRACHVGHGMSRSPMLPDSQKSVCLGCHGSEAGRAEAVGRGLLGPAARPTLIGAVLDLPNAHPISDEAFSRHEPGAVTCSSCHAPHRGTRGSGFARETASGPKPSPLDPAAFEFDLCNGCHGNLEDSGASDPRNIRRLTTVSSRSYHPIEGPSREPSPSVLGARSGRQINCTSCHGNRDPSGPSGPHGSTVRHLLNEDYSAADGEAESATTYGLCYRCHDREKVLASAYFPAHAVHVADRRISCSTCHNPHGSIGHRSMIRFDEEPLPIGIGPSALAGGPVRYESEAPGSGACYLACHGHDHGPAVYGGAPALPSGAAAP